MAKKPPPGWASWQLFIPRELHTKATKIAGYGKVNNLYKQCIEEGIKPRYRKYLEDQKRWVEQQLQAEGYSAPVYGERDEGRQSTIRRGPQTDARETAAKNIRDTGRKKTAKA